MQDGDQRGGIAPTETEKERQCRQYASAIKIGRRIVSTAPHHVLEASGRPTQAAKNSTLQAARPKDHAYLCRSMSAQHAKDA